MLNIHNFVIIFVLFVRRYTIRSGICNRRKWQPRAVLWNGKSMMFGEFDASHKFLRWYYQIWLCLVSCANYIIRIKCKCIYVGVGFPQQNVARSSMIQKPSHMTWAPCTHVIALAACQTKAKTTVLRFMEQGWRTQKKRHQIKITATIPNQRQLCANKIQWR